MQRTRRSILNIVTSIVPSFIIIVLGFLKFKYFINVYGDDLNGVVQLVAQIYAYLSLAELGFGAATNIKLYKYFQTGSEEDIAKVFNESKALYFKSGLFIFVSGILISLVLPFFIKNNSIATYYIIAIMVLYAIDFLADYLYGLPYRNLLIVNEKIYLINLIKTTQQIIFKTIELILILNHVNLLLIICLSVVANLFGSYLLVQITKRDYPFLKKYKGRDRTVSKSVKDILVNNVSDIVNEKTDSIIIANQMGLKDTSIYSMYNLIVNYIYMFIQNFITGIKGSIGAILNNKDIPKKECYDVFKQFLLCMDYITLTCFIVFSVSSIPFMKIFINGSYEINFIAACLFGLILWLNILLKTLHVVIEVKGYYNKVKWMALLQAIGNIVLSIILIKFFGMAGILFATFITELLIVFPRKAKAAFEEFNKKPTFLYNMIIISTLISAFLIFVVMKLNIYKSVSNLISWFGVTICLGIFVATILFIAMFIIFKDYRKGVKRLMNNKIVYKIKRFILSRIAYIHYNLKVKNKNISVYSIEKTLKDLETKKASIIRYGDGEMDLINGIPLKFQDYDEKLQIRLKEILSEKSNDGLFITIPEIFNGLNQYTNEEKEFWAISLFKTYKRWFNICDGEYYNAFLSRPYLRYKDKSNCGKIFKGIKDIFKNKEIILVEGEFSRLGVGNDLFDGAKKVERILCPTKNAFAKYDEILKEVCKQSKDKLILVSLGPTSKLLVYDLYKKGYRALDLGHIDLEYEWFLRKETKKVKIENKFVNEVDNGEENGELNDKKYQKQILVNINKKGKK